MLCERFVGIAVQRGAKKVSLSVVEDDLRRMVDEHRQKQAATFGGLLARERGQERGQSCTRVPIEFRSELHGVALSNVGDVSLAQCFVDDSSDVEADVRVNERLETLTEHKGPLGG